MLHVTRSQSNKHYSGISDSYSTKTCSTVKTPTNFSNLFNEFNSYSSRQNKDTKNIIHSKYYDIKEIQSLNLNHKDASSPFHTNIHPLPKVLKNLNIS